MPNPSDRSIDYAAIARSVMKPSGQKPAWLVEGQAIYAPSHAQGIGKITAILGDRLIAKFPNYSVPVIITNWQEAINRQEILPANSQEITAEITREQEVYDVSEEDIATIPHPEFREIALNFQASLAAIRVTESTEGEAHRLPVDLPSILQEALREQGYTHLWSHQIQSLEAMRNGKDVLLATPTASGKTLSFLPAILETCIQEPQASALLIFPLKALAIDQLSKLEAIAKPMGLHTGMMTGDMPKAERLKLFTPQAPQILCISPDLLHHQLNRIRYRHEWQTWRDFLTRLRYVVIDEAHTYRGSFGGHFANLMRRLRLAVDRLEGNSDRIQYVLATATIGNPIELTERITERRDRLVYINHSGARAAGRTILCLNPTARTNTEASRLILEWLERELSGIVFCNTRAGAKSLLALMNAELERQKRGHLKASLALFYGSLRSDRRNQIIEAVKQNKVRVIFATSALEAGIDLPELDCCLIKGYPGSLMSFYQRIGRAGRHQHGLVVFLPSLGDPLDYYYGSNPQMLLDGEVERALCNPNYHSILSKHLRCAASESMIPASEVKQRFGDNAGNIADELLNQKALQLNEKSGDLFTHDHPHNSVNLRGATQDSVMLVDGNTNQELEELSLLQAYREVFPNAIYAMQSNDGNLQYYRSRSLDLESKQASLIPIDSEPKLRTQATQDMTIKPLEHLREPRLVSLNLKDSKLRLTLSWAEITNHVTGYNLISKVRTITCSHPRCSRYHQPMQSDICTACSKPTRLAEITEVEEENLFDVAYTNQYQAPVLRIEMNLELSEPLQEYANKLKQQIEKQFGTEIPSELTPLFQTEPADLALHSICHQIGIAVPLLVLSDRQDLNSYCETEKNRVNTLKTIAYFFDTTDGGNGTCEELFDRFEAFAVRAAQLVEACNCQYGCPRCLTDARCPQDNQALNKALGLFLLQAISDESEYF